jgi:hypothetical protein
VNALFLLIGLLVLSYLGSMLRGDRAIRGIGLPSGAEYLFLGFILGSHVLGVIPQNLVRSFEPLLIVGASWIAFIAGLVYTQIGERRIVLHRALVGIIGTALVGAGVGAAVWFALPLVTPQLMSDRVLLSAGIAIVSCASTRQAVRWVVQRHAASGPLSDALADFARASAIVPVLGLALLLAWFPDPKLAVFSFGLRASLAWGVGILLGLVGLLLASRGIKRDEMWGILVGTSLLAIGVSARLGLSSVAAAFAMGLTLGVASRRRAELAAMLRPTERAVLLPLAVLAGALVDLRGAPAIAWLVPLALAARFLAELVRGLWLLTASRSARRAGPLVGYNLLSTGDVSLACAVSIAFSFEGAAALSILAVASAGVIVGELLAPLALKRSLGRAGELESSAGEPWSRASDAPEGIQL